MSLTKYKNLSGRSSIESYFIDDEAGIIYVSFQNGAIYAYDKESIGFGKFQIMKALAIKGEGLCGFINIKENGIRSKGRKIFGASH